MRVRRCEPVPAALILTCFMTVAPLSAQSVEQSQPVEQHDQKFVITITLEQEQELQLWKQDFLEWQKSVDRWLNLRKQGSWSAFLERHKKPDPPAWLHDACP